MEASLSVACMVASSSLYPGWLRRQRKNSRSSWAHSSAMTPRRILRRANTMPQQLHQQWLPPATAVLLLHIAGPKCSNTTMTARAAYQHLHVWVKRVRPPYTPQARLLGCTR
jgi:hypothetical protein